MRHSPPAETGEAFDLHVLGMPPAFVLSQDQTLRFALARRLAASGKAQGIYARIFLTEHACNNTLLAPPPAHPFHTHNVNEQSKDFQRLSADARTATLPRRRDELRLQEAVQTDDRRLI